MLGLVADIGSTNARFALTDLAAGSASHLRHAANLLCADYPSLAAVTRRYLSELPADLRPRVAAFAVAGPIEGDSVTLTNHDWRFSVVGLRDELGLERLSVLNDFAAISLSLPSLPRTAFVAIGPTRTLPAEATVGVIGPGSGLGVGGLLRRQGRLFVIPSEGGHASFAPQDAREWQVARHLAARFGHVSNERLLSGPGLVNIHTALSPDSERSTPLSAAEITERALAGTDPRCGEALTLFCGVLGAAAGDLALLLYADAVFIAGGIVPRFLPFLADSPFRAQFEAKGRFAAHLAQVPTFVITDPHPGLLGAAAHLAQDIA